MSALDQLSPQQRYEYGASLRREVKRSSHADWTPDGQRPDPVALLAQQDETRLQWLVPYKYERMLESSFAFFRGSAAIMAADLARTPSAGIQTQLCGDAHLSNFGMFGSPERNLIFDINDFDETLRGPWEWDLKRLATSFAIAARHNGLKRSAVRNVVANAVHYYRQGMVRLSEMSTIDVWYFHVRATEIEDFLAAEMNPTKKQKRAMARQHAKRVKKAHARDSSQALSKIAEQVNGSYRIVSNPPFIVPIFELLSEYHPDDIRAAIDAAFEQYKASLPDARRYLLDQYQLVEVALRVGGVGSVGTRCYIALFEGKHLRDPLVLQLKEAGQSVLEEFLDPPPYEHHGQRVVEGQRLMQAVSDSFLGWSTVEREGSSVDYYWRQLRDMKLSLPIEEYGPDQLDAYARLCGITLARAHARTGDANAIAGYIGKGEVFTDALTAFAETYADQNERDFAALVQAIGTGSITRDADIQLAS